MSLASSESIVDVTRDVGSKLNSAVLLLLDLVLDLDPTDIVCSCDMWHGCCWCRYVAIVQASTVLKIDEDADGEEEEEEDDDDKHKYVATPTIRSTSKVLLQPLHLHVRG
mmetsp:Transcript_304/g.746  ORF Transcript_304/g.746 Transcript_304/m.746 type:complete len:110 (-) Transcript_304:94-423(-)